MGAWEGRATSKSKEGRTSSAATAAMRIIAAVITPYAEKRGIGANANTAKPVMLEAAEPARATPVPEAAARSASTGPGWF